MDLLYSKYASPMDLIHLYFEQGRFGELVTHIIEAENKRRKEEAEKEDERMLWEMYVHSMTDKSFNEWKKQVLKPQEAPSKKDLELTDSDIQAIIDKTFSK